ncbi:amino acid kinase family protein [Rickettsia hoogstraalii]|uniref:acetylglutamate kinase n=1 Tax=Rickettsia hoogstraalii TaxID=467174 RepID=UPI00059004CA|nr:acetylglutamate kinase [Rickettsia hoogstraalii]
MQENLKLVWQNASNLKGKEVDSISSLNNIAIIKNIIKCSSELKNQAIVLKLPATIIIDNKLFTAFIESVRLLEMCGAKIYIVHDHIDLRSSSLISQIDENFSQKISKISDYSSLNNPIIMEILSSYVNKLIVTKLSSIGCYAVGILGKDANLLQAKKSKLSHRKIVNHDVINVIAPFANDDQEKTHLLNVNLTVATIASALSEEHLILPYEILQVSETFPYNIKIRDINLLKSMLDDSNNFIEEELIKIAVNALENNNGYVHFVNSEVPNSILSTMFDININ